MTVKMLNVAKVQMNRLIKTKHLGNWGVICTTFSRNIQNVIRKLNIRMLCSIKSNMADGCDLNVIHCCISISNYCNWILQEDEQCQSNPTGKLKT